MDTACPAGAAAVGEAAPRLLALVRAVSDELRPQSRLAGTLGWDHSLERDYGLDSLARVELLGRIGSEFGVALAESALTDAETPRDLLRLIAAASDPGAASAALAEPAQPVATAARADAAADAPAAVPAGYPPRALQTLVDVLEWHVQRQPQRVLITLYGEGEALTELRYADLRADAVALAAGLRDAGIGHGDKVAIMLPTGREFFAAFLGTLYAGGVPVPVYPPARPSQLEDHLRRIAGILRNARARLLVTVARARPLSHLLRAQAEGLRAVVTPEELARPADDFVPPTLQATDIAFLQYTSGSTGDPKGVILTHANLLANLRAMWQAARIDARDTFVSWLPLYHDMGLIGACLGGMVVGYRVVLLSPLAFLAQPARWLRAIHRHRGTVSAAPNFAYELCAARLADADLEGLDLSCWRLAFNGAEPVSPDTMERFASRLARCGFAREALMPVYGLAESALGVAFPPLGRGPLVDLVDRAALARNGMAARARPGDARPLRVVCCGLPLPGHEIRVADDSGRELPEREQGQVQFRGPSATQGYFDNRAANEQLFAGDWLNSGDLGYIAGGELYLTGRRKDIIIRGGVNIHPQELESAVAALADVRQGGVAVFAASDAHSGTERLVVLAETRIADAAGRRRLVQQITALSADLLGAPADDVVLVPPRTVLKTSSGKIRRAACRELHEQGRLGLTQRAPWRQWLALATAAAAARSRRALRDSIGLAWGLWAWALFCAFGALAWCALMSLPGLERRRRVARALARAVVGLAGLPLRVQGLQHLRADRAAVVVANHASYLDAILLVAALPPRLTFVAKSELARVPLVGAGLRRLGVAFVERADAARGVEDTLALQARVRAGESMVFFPEGGFSRASGLRPFKLGAFVIAAESGAAVVPVTLDGTRSLLREAAWMPRRVEVGVTVSEPVAADGPGWQSALELRDAVRQVMGGRLAEASAEG